LGSDPATRRLALQWGVLCSLFATVFSGAVLLMLQQDNWRLESALRERDATVHHLEAQGARLMGELDTATANLSATAEEVARLQEQAQALEGNANQLSQEVARFHGSYAQLQQERSGLIDRVLELEQERTMALRRSVPLEELQLAIRETIARKQAARSFFTPTRNRGYLVWDGRSTMAVSDRSSRPVGRDSFVQVRVHEPQVWGQTPSD
jgi:septal ring factor EnvC (AmiA/AmiB activator)